MNTSNDNSVNEIAIIYILSNGLTIFLTEDLFPHYEINLTQQTVVIALLFRYSLINSNAIY